ncbi:sialin-like [Copidosoma floridanum]|uniref:sialin-like n=1 Tax=Copidosoma floridanum TaxID=29053 RepID=UPI0006C93C2F|nr:sialin-like [Copidosoma floridanum]
MLSSWTGCCSCISQRWTFSIMSFLALCIGNAMRSVLSITITEMVYPIHNVTNQTHERCIAPTEHAPDNATAASFGDRYHWDEFTQGLILSSIFWGYAPTQFIYGSLAERFGGKYFLGQAIFIPSLLTLATPLVIDWGGSTALIIIRILMGVSSSAMYPSVSSMVPHWTTAKNRTRFGTFICAGFILGPVFGTVMPALIIKYTGSGWPAVFYFFGALGISWFPFWVLLCFNNSDDHPFITDRERRYLQDSLEKEVCKKPPPAPYAHIFRSKQVWAFVIGLFGCDWAYFTMATDLPKFMSNIVGLPIDQNGYLSALPYLCMWLNSTLSSWLVDWVIARDLMTITNVKKLLTVVAAIGSSGFILLATYSGCDLTLIVACFVASITLMGCAYPSIMMNNLDLSPNYAGTLMAFGNGVAALGGVFSPYLVGVLTKNQTMAEWRMVFWIGFFIALASSVFVAFHSSSDIQYWNDPNFERDANKVVTKRTKKKYAGDGKIDTAVL